MDRPTDNQVHVALKVVELAATVPIDPAAEKNAQDVIRDYLAKSESPEFVNGAYTHGLHE